MKIKVENYVFDKVAKTVTFTGYTTIALNQILIISNATANITIYDFDTIGKGGTVATNVLTLVYDTSAMNNTDKLFIYLDDTNKLATENSVKLLAMETTQKELTDTLLSLNRTLEVMVRQMPRLSKDKVLKVDLSETGMNSSGYNLNTISSITFLYDLLRLNSFGDVIARPLTRTADAIPQQLARVSALYLYDNIKFTN
jgi:hypothetical protein